MARMGVFAPVLRWDVLFLLLRGWAGYQRFQSYQRCLGEGSTRRHTLLALRTAAGFAKACPTTKKADACIGGCGRRDGIGKQPETNAFGAGGGAGQQLWMVEGFAKARLTSKRANALVFWDVEWGVREGTARRQTLSALWETLGDGCWGAGASLKLAPPLNRLTPGFVVRWAGV